MGSSLIFEFYKPVAIALSLFFDTVSVLHRAVALKLEVELVVSGLPRYLFKKDLLFLLELLEVGLLLFEIRFAD